MTAKNTNEINISCSIDNAQVYQPRFDWMNNGQLNTQHNLLLLPQIIMIKHLKNLRSGVKHRKLASRLVALHGCSSVSCCLYLTNNSIGASIMNEGRLEVKQGYEVGTATTHPNGRFYSFYLWDGLVMDFPYSNWSYEYCNYIVINMVTFWSVLALVHPSCHQFDDYSDYW